MFEKKILLYILFFVLYDNLHLNMLIAILAGIGLFMFLVLVHELWHFIAAKKSWVKVLEFWIWIPPKAFTVYKDKSWTEYTINWLPLWWFVRLKWENPEDAENFLAKDSFITQSLIKKLIILFWWVAVNLFFAWLFFATAFWKWIEPISIVPESMISIDTNSYLMPTRSFLEKKWFLSWSVEEIPVEVLAILPWEAAYNAWIITWDVLLKVDDIDVNSINLWETLRWKIWKSFVLTYEREWELFEETIQCRSDRCMLWIIMWQWWNIELLPIKFWFLDWSVAAWSEIVAQTKLTFHVLWNVWKKLLTFEKEQAKEAVENLAWPVWAVKVWEVILDNFWIWQYIAFWWMISLALAIFNVLPIPALDWWRALSVIIQSLWRFRPEKYFVIENYINVAFFMLLMWLWIYIIFMDLARFWWVNPFWLGF